jgi:hypothetical protein
MTGIRPLRREDLPAVCALYERVVRSGSSDPPVALPHYFERTFLDHPWADDEQPSLVYEDADGVIVGFLGCHARRVRLDGRLLRMACGGQLVAAPDARHPGVGALLTRRFLAGPQDITITDGATDYMRRIWTGFGGQTVVGASIGWLKALRPAAAAAAVATRRGHPVLGKGLRLAAPAADAAARWALRRSERSAPHTPRTTVEILTADMLVEQVGVAARNLRFYPDYDVAFVKWLFTELAVVHVRGVPVRHLVRDDGGKVLGWYVYYLTDHGIAEVLQVAAPTGGMSAVLDHLLWHADTHGAAAVRGRVEPALIGELRFRGCVLTSTEYSLVHAEDPSLLAVLSSPLALLSRLDGEWWMGHHLLWRSGRDPSGASWATVQ